jgi:hypothetical protein
MQRKEGVLPGTKFAEVSCFERSFSLGMTTARLKVDKEDGGVADPEGKRVGAPDVSTTLG